MLIIFYNFFNKIIKFNIFNNRVKLLIYLKIKEELFSYACLVHYLITFITYYSLTLFTSREYC